MNVRATEENHTNFTLDVIVVTDAKQLINYERLAF